MEPPAHVVALVTPKNHPWRADLLERGNDQQTPELDVTGAMPTGVAVAHAVNDWLLELARTPRVQVPEVSAESLRRARRVQDRYASLRLSLTDTVNVILA